MPANTPRGYPYPLPTEPVAEGAQAIRNLAEALKGLTLIEDKPPLTATAANFDFTAIPQTFSALKIILVGRGDNAASMVDCWMRFNGATTGYDFQRLNVSAAAVTASETLATLAIVVASLPGNLASAGMAASSDILIPDYNGTAFQKNALISTYDKRSEASTGLFLRQLAGTWRSTAPITRVTVLPGAGNFVIGSRATLYGVG